jgi:hypothetical protein
MTAKTQRNEGKRIGKNNEMKINPTKTLNPLPLPFVS